MLYEIKDKKVQFNYKFYSESIRVACPFHRYDSTHNSQIYKTLKQLSWHISNQHAGSNTNSPFTVEQVREILKALAIAKQWRILV